MFWFLLVVSIVAFFIFLAFGPKGWRTVIANVIMGMPLMLGDILHMLQGFDWTQFLTAPQATAMGLWIAIANIILRYATTTPVGKA